MLLRRPRNLCFFAYRCLCWIFFTRVTLDRQGRFVKHRLASNDRQHVGGIKLRSNHFSRCPNVQRQRYPLMQATRVTRRVITRRLRFFYQRLILARAIRFVVRFHSSELRMFVNHFHARRRRAYTQVERRSNPSTMNVSFVFSSVQRRAATRVPSRRHGRRARFRMVEVLTIRQRAARTRQALRNVLLLRIGPFANVLRSIPHTFRLLYHAASPKHFSPIAFGTTRRLKHRLAQRMRKTITQIVVTIVRVLRHLRLGTFVVLRFNVTSRQVQDARGQAIRLLTD